MGLDMYVEKVTNPEDPSPIHLITEADYVPFDGAQVEEFWYWRKHPNLHGWMERLWESKGKPGYDQANPNPMNDGPMFNGIELELTAEDLDALERAVVHGQLPSTQGFFFGDDADEHYRESDLEFIKNARAELFFGLKVFYNSSW